MRNKIFILIFGLFLYKISFSQIDFSRNKNILVYHDTIAFNNAWNGGINSAQFSEIDLNLDGIKDLIIFDRSGNKLSPYLNINDEFIFSPEYRDKFPSIESWILIEDYNCDGMNDLFTYSNAGISVYINTSTSSLYFSLLSSQLINQLIGAGCILIFQESTFNC